MIERRNVGIAIFYTIIMYIVGAAACSTFSKIENKHRVSCEVLELVLSDNSIDSFFSIQTRKIQPIILWDETKITICKEIIVNGNKINVTKDENKYRLSNHLNASWIVITNLDRANDVYTLSLYDPSVSSWAIVEYKKIEQSFVIINHKFGYNVH